MRMNLNRLLRNCYDIIHLKNIIYDTMDKFMVKTADNSTRIKPLGTNKCRQVVW